MDFDRRQFLPRDAILARYMLWPCVHQSVSVKSTDVDKGEQGAQPPMAGQKFFFWLKYRDFQVSQQLSLIQASLQLNPVVHVTITQRERGTANRCPTCILV